MKHRHILTAIHAMEDKEYQIRTQIAYYAKFQDYHNAEIRELHRLREQEVKEALNEFKPLLTTPIAEVQAILNTAASTTPAPAPVPPLSPETVNKICWSLEKTWPKARLTLGRPI